jgi:hypothetical protein
MTGNLGQKKYFFKESHLLAFFGNKLVGILLAKPSNCHHSTSNQIEPIHLFIFLPLTAPPPPPAYSHYRNDTQNANMTSLKLINNLQSQS